MGGPEWGCTNLWQRTIFDGLALVSNRMNCDGDTHVWSLDGSRD